MKALGLIVGLLGIPCLLFPPLGIFLLILGALMYIVGGNNEKRQLEEQRHQEMIDAVQRGQYPPRQ